MTAAPAYTSPAVVGEDEKHPLRFVVITELVWQLPARQRNVLIGLLTFCWNAPRCWPAQKSLAAVVHCSVGSVNLGLCELVAAGVITKRYQRHGKRKTCIYEIVAPGYWQPAAKNPRVSAQRSKFRTEVDSSKKEERRPPVSPPTGGDAELPLDRNVGEQEAPGTEAEPIEAPPDAAQADDPPPAAGQNMGFPMFKPAQDEARPFYRNRQRRPGDPPKPRRKRRRERRKDLYEIGLELIAEWEAEEARAAGQPPPEIEILPPNRMAAVRQHDGPSGVIMNLWLGAKYVLDDLLAKDREQGPDPDAGDDPAERLLAAGGFA